MVKGRVGVSQSPVAKGNCVVERRGGKRPEANRRSAGAGRGANMGRCQWADPAPEQNASGDCRYRGQGFEFLGYRLEAGRRWVRNKSLRAFKAKVRDKTRRSRGAIVGDDYRRFEPYAARPVWLLQARPPHDLPDSIISWRRTSVALTLDPHHHAVDVVLLEPLHHGVHPFGAVLGAYAHAVPGLAVR